MIKLDCKFYNVPGILLSTAEKSNRVHHYAFGVSNVATDAPMVSQGLFCCGVITRLFTMGIVMRLADKGAFDLDAPLEWLANKHQQDRGILKILVSQYPILKPVTVRELLNNTSGLPAFDKTIAYNEIFTAKPRKVWQIENYLDAITGVSVKFQHGYLLRPRGYFSDSSTNYLLAGLVIDAVSGLKTNEAMRDLFREFGLSSTHYLSYGQMNKSIINQMTHGYLPVSHPFSQAFLGMPRVIYNENKELLATDVTSAYNINGMGNAAVVSSTSDLIKWFKQLVNAKVVAHNYKQLFKSISIKTFSSGSKTSYCFGFYKTISDEHDEILWTAGNSLGYGVLLVHVVSRDLTFVLLVNVSREYMSLYAEGLVADVLRLLL